MNPNSTVDKLTAEELSKFEADLLERRRILLGDFQSIEDGDARDASELSGNSTHIADLGSDRASSDVSLGRRESASGEIQEIDDALERIRDGSFGLCESCEKGIVKERLEAIPYARLCLPCKVEEEE